jgi:hypothetical protein
LLYGDKPRFTPGGINGVDLLGQRPNGVEPSLLLSKARFGPRILFLEAGDLSLKVADHVLDTVALDRCPGRGAIAILAAVKVDLPCTRGLSGHGRLCSPLCREGARRRGIGPAFNPLV